MLLSDRDRLLLAFANLASYGIAARPAMAGDAAGLSAELRVRHPRGLGSYVFWPQADEGRFDAYGSLSAALILHCSGEEALRAALASCRRFGVDVTRAGSSCALTVTPRRARDNRDGRGA